MDLGKEFEEDLRALPPSQRDEVLKAILDLSEGKPDLFKSLILRDFEEPPVDILTFIDDPKYLGGSLVDRSGKSKVYPYWRDALVEIFKSGCTQIVLTGPIGGGKSTLIDICMCFHAYYTVNLRDPFEFYGMVRAEPIAFLFFSITKDLSQVGLYKGFMELLTNSPWFKERGTLRGTKDQWLDFSHRNIQWTLGSPKIPGYGIVGKNIISGGLDEISEITTVKEIESGESLDLVSMKALKIFRQVDRRMSSRFQRVGVMPGKLYLASSKQDKAAFLEQYVEQVKNRPDVLIFDDPLWVIQPKARFSGKFFSVGVGDRFKTSLILPPGSDEAKYKSDGYDVLEVPVEYKSAFELDINGALCDIAGISSAGGQRSKLIAHPEYLMRCVDTGLLCPFSVETVYLSEHDEEGIEEYFKIWDGLKTPHPRFAHIDLSINGDSGGMALGHVSGVKKIDRTSEDGTQVSMQDLIFTVDFMIQLRNLEGSHLPFWKIRRFLLYLRKLGVNIVWVTLDGFQSEDSQQLLRRAEIQSDTLSIDRDDKPYLHLRSAVVEERMRYYKYSVFLQEAASLEHHRRAKKVDHPQGGSKDVADCVAGILTQSMRNPVEAPQTGKMVDSLKEITKSMRGGGLDANWWMKEI